MPRDVLTADSEPFTPAEMAEALEDALSIAVEALSRVNALSREAGPAGADGAPGVRGADGVGLAAAAVDENGRLVLSLSDGRVLPLGVVRGERGDRGPEGPPGRDGVSIQGDRGLPGSDGRDGRDGKDGINGVNGRDAPIIPGPAGRSVTSTKIDDRGHLVLSYSDGTTEDAGIAAIKGDKGDRGDAGRDGERGADGPMGRGIASLSIVSGALHARYTDGEEVIVGKVVGDRGPDGKTGPAGVGVSDVGILNGNLQVTFTDGRSEDVGRVVGQDGRPGRAGDPGAEGPQGPMAMALEIGESLPARLSASDLSKVRVLEMVIDGQVVRVLALD